MLSMVAISCLYHKLFFNVLVSSMNVARRMANSARYLLGCDGPLRKNEDFVIPHPFQIFLEAFENNFSYQLSG